MKFFGFKYYFQLILVCIAGSSVNAQDSLSNGSIPDSVVQTYQISDILIEGNQKTREGIILRELSFSVGDKLDLAKLERALEESKSNLLKQPLFNFVTIEKKITGDELVQIKIIVEERWFVWPQLSILNNDRNFNTWWQTKDLSKLDYRLAVTQYNVLGLNHILKIELSYGYTRELSISYKNIFLDKKQHHFLGVSASYLQQKTVFYRTFNNTQESFTSADNDAITGKYIKLKYGFRPRHKSWHLLTVSFKDIEATDSLVSRNPDFLANKQTQNSYSEIQYRFIFDRRDSRSYPLSGNWFDLNLVKTGLGLDPGNPINLFHVRGTAKQFYNITERFYGSHSISIKKSFENDQPFYFKQGLGFKDYLRGFEYYVIEGEDYYLLKNTLKFGLLPTKISTLNFIPIKKFKKIHYAFYLTAFFDIGVANEKNKEIVQNNMLSNKLLYSTGLGFDIATYYDKVIRFEYSLNSLGETGLFIHFKASI